MNRREALQEGARILAGEGRWASGTPSLDASLLLAHVLGLPRDRLLASFPEILSETELASYRGLLELRRLGRPIAYILGHKEFWGRVFLVDDRVLIPRPDTELLVETSLHLGRKLLEERRHAGLGEEGGGAVLACHEACTGSGCVAISLALERPAWRITASDISEAALEVARLNAERLLDGFSSKLVCFKADLFEGLEGSYDLLIANPPYVESAEAGELAAVWGEPRLALDGGSDGLDPYRRLLPSAVKSLAPGGFLILEAGPEQATKLRGLFADAGLVEVGTDADLAGRPRVTLGRKPWTT
jgi:release factor glutamine methyltransferase